MPESPIRYIQCPYCKRKYGIRRDEPLDLCFFCGGVLNLEARVHKPSAVLVMADKATRWVGKTIQSAIDQARTPAEDELPQTWVADEPPAEEAEYPDEHLHTVPPAAPFMFDDLPLAAETEDDFNPLDLIEPDHKDLAHPAPVEEPQAAVVPPVVPALKPEPAHEEHPPLYQRRKTSDPVELLRPAATDIPTAPVYLEEVVEDDFFTKYRKWILIGIAGVVVLMLVLVFASIAGG